MTRLIQHLTGFCDPCQVTETVERNDMMKEIERLEIAGTGIKSILVRMWWE